MKHIKDKDKLKSKSKNWKARFVHDGDAVERVVLEKPSKPRSKIKASVTDMGMTHVSEELIPDGQAPAVSKQRKVKAEEKPSKPVMNRKEKKAHKKKLKALEKGGKLEPNTKKDDRARAPVHSINEKKMLHSVTSKEIADEAEKLDAHIVKHEQVKASNEERTLVDQPKPPVKVDSVKQAEVPTTVVEAVTEPVRSEVRVEDNQVWIKGGAGSVIRNTGDGMTPSGKPISDYLCGGKYAPTGTMNTECWKEMFPQHYTHEEQGKKIDELQLAIQQQAHSYQQRIEGYKDRENTMLRNINDLRAELSVKGFNLAHISKGEGVVPKGFDEQECMIIELETENSYLSKSQDDLRKEVNQLSDYVEQLEEHEKVRAHSKPPIVALAQYFVTFKNNFETMPIRTFLKAMGFSITLEKPLTNHFNVTAKAETVALERHAAAVADGSVKPFSGNTPPVQKVVTENTYGIMDGMVRLPNPINQYHKLHSVTSALANRSAKINKNDESFNMFEYYPSARTLDSEEYCKVWAGFDLLGLEFHMKEHLLMQSLTKTHRYIVNPMCSAIKGTKSFLNFELSPSIRKATEDRAKVDVIEASAVKKAKEDAIEKELKAEEHAKGEGSRRVNASRVNLQQKGFVITDTQHSWQVK